MAESGIRAVETARTTDGNLQPPPRGSIYDGNLLLHNLAERLRLWRKLASRQSRRFETRHCDCAVVATGEPQTPGCRQRAGPSPTHDGRTKELESGTETNTYGCRPDRIACDRGTCGRSAWPHRGGSRARGANRQRRTCDAKLANRQPDSPRYPG